MAPIDARETPKEWMATVSANRPRGGGYHQLSLRLPARFPIPSAGAFLMISAGAEPDILLRRPMAFYDAVKVRDRVYVEVLYAVVGRGTKRMATLRPGSEISFLGPLGNSFSQPKEGENVAIVAGGIGIAPFLLWGRQLAAAQRKQVRLLLGFSNRNQIPVGRDFTKVHLKPTVAVEGPGGDFRGTAVELLEREMDTTSFDRILTCGPEKMMERVIEVAAERQIPCEVSLEAKMGCGHGLCLSCVTKSGAEAHDGYSLVCRDGPIFLH
jgi:dihydroorotate dehydrogenase electron transfer subunit